MREIINWVFIPLLMLTFINTYGQEITLKGKVVNTEEEAVPFANVILFDGEENEMLKTGVTSLEGQFELLNVEKGDYVLVISFIGLEDFRKELLVEEGTDFGTIKMNTTGVQIETAVVKAKRALVEVKPDKTVFNVEGTINSAGDDAIGLLRKAPGVLLDNNNNITVLGRSGVKVFINGKELPLSGEELTNYLESLTSEQIDRIDIISNPGAKYDAEGNAGIIDIRLKKNKEFGSNGTFSTSYGQGRYGTYNANLGLNTRSNAINVFGNLGYNKRKSFSDIYFENELNNLYLEESNISIYNRNGYSAKLGVDYYLDDHQTFGVLYSGGWRDRDGTTTNRIEISPLSQPRNLDSILVANNTNYSNNEENTFNLNYAFQSKGKTLNIDADYGRYRNEGGTDQPNTYYDANEELVLSEYNTEFSTPVDIDIYTFKVDYEQGFLGGNLAFGSKLSKVVTDNTYLFYELDGDSPQLVDTRSNQFTYDENVYAAYANYRRPLSKKWNVSGGLRMEYTDALGELTAFDPELQEDPVLLQYLDYFPSLGLSYQIKQGNTLNINYGRRLNRPNYNVLNPFREQLSELSFRKGNPFLSPEIVNNYEIGYTHNWRYNVKFSYSRTLNEITRLIGPDDKDPRASFLSWDNLATKDVFALNLALPFQFTDWWNAFFNLSGSHINNQADYGGGAVVDLQAWSYNIFSQQSFQLPWKLTAEISGWFSGPGIWGGVFLYDTNWSLNVGLQRKFFNDQLNVKLSGNDLFYESGWSGYSSFDGLTGYGRGNWDSRRVSLNISYKFGNSKIKKRDRKTGIEEESSRIGD